MRNRDHSLTHFREVECPECGVIFAILPQDTAKKRVDPHDRILKVTRRITRAGGNEYLHHVIQAKVPAEWKPACRVRIEPIRGRKDSYISIKRLRMGERDTYYHTRYSSGLSPEKLEEYFKRGQADADRAEEIWQTHVCIHCINSMREMFEKEKKLKTEEKDRET